MKRKLVFASVGLWVALCASPVAAQDYANLGASLFENYVTGGGADDAEGDFNGEADFRRSRLCYYLEIEGLDDANGVAIHQADVGEDGPETLALALPAENGDEVCVTADAALLRAIGEAPADYYVIIRSESHPNGAIRGQLHD